MMVDKAEEEGSLSCRNMEDIFNSGDGGDGDLYLDLDSFWREMGGVPFEGVEPDQGNLDDSHFLNTIEGMENSPKVDVPESCLPSPMSEASDCRTACSEGFSEFVGKSTIPDSERLEASSPHAFAEIGCSQTVTDCMPLQGSAISYTHAGGEFWTPLSDCLNETNKAPVSHSETFSNYGSNHTLHNVEPLDLRDPNHEGDLFGGTSGAYGFSENLYNKKLMEERDLGASVFRIEDSFVMDSDVTSQDASHTESSSYEVTEPDMADLLSESGGLYTINSEDVPCFPYSSGVKSLSSHDGRMADLVDDRKNSTGDSLSMSSYEYLASDEVGQHNGKCQNGSTVFFNSRLGATDMHPVRSQITKPSQSTFSNVFGKMRNHIKVEKNMESITSNEIVSRASGAINDVITRDNRCKVEPPTKCIPWSLSNSSSLISQKNYVPCAKIEQELFFDPNGAFRSHSMVDKTSEKNSAIVAHNRRHVLQLSGSPDKLASSNIKAEPNLLKMDNVLPKFNDYSFSAISYQGVQNKRIEQINIDDDTDLCILEDMSAPARPSLTEMRAKLVAASHFSSSRESSGHIVSGHSRPKPNDERVIFRVALQDLSQPKSEAYPPEGTLAVPLLKHQRVALSWMVNKETKSACCSGGILADDQGLGKTVSTISLILKERSPSSKALKTIEEQVETETLNLDEDDEGAFEANLSMAGAEFLQDNDCSSYFRTSQQAMGRPAAGTLIVCPTSVLRQWSEELHTKVTSEAKLSVLVYHGSNRIKDPTELAKYDVVVTTYAIVSMEVPKQPVVDDNDDAIGTPFEGFSSGKKRKPLENMGSKKASRCKKNKKGIEHELLETLSGPLAKVGWFRVVLDEAQSIKNHRTQVARACWGLRAKRRWCLSGTPIQNSIDDLYSYFRFLRHEPYAVFATFCEQIKAPIQRNPKNGYKKLQAVLKTIMLRRTKGTVINGEPIIDLPPKTIKLQQVDFSEEERDFYRTLEAESQAQFAEYAAKGTVKQNYVNILLMLLRLRQACDHPLLVKDCNSTSKMTSSIKTAKRLPREKQLSLLNCLEASLAICGICNDPPEDAVVTVCGHVFCNQCICEHMIGDESQCPSKNCRAHLTAAYIFSITSLRIALSDQPSIENTPSSSDSELAKVSEPRALSSPEDSSKIKAALELLLSLSRPQDCASRTSSSEFIKGSPGSEMLHACGSGGQNGASDMNIDLNASVKIVGEKAIVFSQWTRMLDLLEACLKNSSIQYRRLDGTMAVTARDRAVKDFNSIPEVSVMIMSLKAASLGLNMVAACNVLLLDLWWNPTTEDQAIDRAHRIGQTRPVSVFRLTVRDTVEDRILALQQRKREMVASAFGEDETGSRQTRLTVDDLKYLFRVD